VWTALGQTATARCVANGVGVLYFSNISTGFKTVSTYAILCMLIAAVQQSVKIRLRLRLVNFAKSFHWLVITLCILL
jgi:hypothetical protein